MGTRYQKYQRSWQYRITPELQGIEKAIAALRKVSDAYGSDLYRLRGTLLHGAKIIAGRAKTLAPLGHTWHLRAGIVAKSSKIMAPDRVSAFAAIDYKIAPHAHFVEFGTVPRWTGKGSDVRRLKHWTRMKKRGKRAYWEPAYRGRMPEKPFFRPAVVGSREEIIKMIKHDCEQYVREAAKASH